MFFNSKCNFNEIKNLNSKQILTSVVAASITLASSIILINLLQRTNVSYVMPHIQPLVLLLTMIIGYFIFQEKLNNYQLFGAVLTILGLWLLNKKN